MHSQSFCCERCFCCSQNQVEGSMSYLSVITRYDFSTLFCQAFDASLTIRNIKSEFQVTGMYPLIKSVISFPEDDFQQSELLTSSGLDYIPLYSNSPFRKPSVMNTTSESNSESDEEEFVPHGVGIYLLQLQRNHYRIFLTFKTF